MLRGLFIAAISATAIAPSSFAGSPARNGLSFQGITGSSTLQEVKRAFPEAVDEGLLCSHGEKTALFANGYISCTALTVKNYQVDGLPFEITFFFSPDLFVSEVSVQYSWGMAFEGEKLPKSAIYSTQERLHAALTAKYGTELDQAPCLSLEEDPKSNLPSFDLCSIWQPGNALWSSDYDYIELKVSAFRKPDDTLYFGSAQVNYQFAATQLKSKF